MTQLMTIRLLYFTFFFEI